MLSGPDRYGVQQKVVTMRLKYSGHDVELIAPSNYQQVTTALMATRASYAFGAISGQLDPKTNRIEEIYADPFFLVDAVGGTLTYYSHGPSYHNNIFWIQKKLEERYHCTMSIVKAQVPHFYLHEGDLQPVNPLEMSY